MRHVLTAEAMGQADQLTIEEFGIPGFTLMETAGRHVADVAGEVAATHSGLPIAVVCGTGNNGGDGLVAARSLFEKGHRVCVLLADDASRLPKDTTRNLDLLREIEEKHAGDRLTIKTWEPGILPPGLGCIIDGLLGTGVKTLVREPFYGIIEMINDHPAPIVAIDLPSGLHPDTGLALGVAVRADTTVTMAASKLGLLLNDGPAYAGRVVTAEIGIPGFILDNFAVSPSCAWLTTQHDVSARLPQRASDAHKYSVGMLLVVAGSPGFTGAPVMASESALRSGAGAVVCACPESVREVLARKMTEVMTRALPESDGKLDVAAALDAVTPDLQRAAALLIGCGFGRAAENSELVRNILRETEVTTVIDADALFALSTDSDFISSHSRGRWILTPHKGEFDRLAGIRTEWNERVELARRYAREWDCVLVLKGLPSVAASPDGSVYINPTGNPALATAGTGDVLAGTISGFAAQGLAPIDAAIAGLYVGGWAADNYADSERIGMIATDLISRIPISLKEISDAAY